MPRLIIPFLLLFFASVSQSAIVFSPERPVSTPVYGPAVRTETAAAAVSDDEHFLVLWSNGPLYASRVSASGEVQVPPVQLRVGTPQNISACWSGSAYLVTWTDWIAQGVMLASLSRDGKPLTAPHLILPQARTFAGALASNGKNALLAYATGNGSVTRAALLDPDGNVLRPDIPSPAIASTIDDAVTVVSDGNNFAEVWRAASAFQIARFDSSGQPLDLAGVQIGTNATARFGVAYGGGRYAVVSMQVRFPSPTATLVRFMIDAATLKRTDLPPIDTAGFDASVAWNGSEFVAYWMHYDYNQFQLNTVEGTHPPITPFSGDVLGKNPMLVTNGRNFLAVWTDRSRTPAFQAGGDLFGAFLDLGGNAESAKFVVGYDARPQFKPAIATSGSDALVVWDDQTTDAGTGILLAARMAADGTILDNPPIDLGGDACVAVNEPAVVFTGEAYFVAWEEATTGTLRGRRVDRNGQLGDIIDFGPGLGPAAASNGKVTLVAFERGMDMLAIRIDASGKVLDNTPLMMTDDGATKASVASNGTDFLVVWTRPIVSGVSPPFVISGDVFAARVSASGAVDAAPVAIATGPDDQYGGIVASDGRDYLVVYHHGDKLAAKSVTAEGATSDETVITASYARDFSLAAEAGGYALVWEDVANGRLQLTELDTSGTPRESATVAQFDPGYVSTFPSVTVSGAAVEVAYDRLAEQYEFAQRVYVRVGAAPRGRAVRSVK